MVGAGYVIELLFGGLGLIPAGATPGGHGIHPLELHDLSQPGVPGCHRRAVLRFTRTGGIPMLKMIGGAPDAAGDHGHHATAGH